jgi:hypothetical protein
MTATNDRATVFQTSVLGPETTYGTAATTYRDLTGVNHEVTINVANRTRHRAQGKRFTTVVAGGWEHTTIRQSGPVLYDQFGYTLAGALGDVSPTTVGTTGRKRIWTPPQRGLIIPKSYTIVAGDPNVRAERATGCINTGLTINWDPSNITFTSDMIGQLYEDPATYPADVDITALPQTVALGSQLDLFMDDTAANIGTTQMPLTFAGSMRLTGLHGPVKPVDSRVPSFKRTVNMAPTAEFDVTMETDDDGMHYLTRMRQSDNKTFLRLVAHGDTIPASSPTTAYRLQMDCCGAVDVPSAMQDTDGVWTVRWTFATSFDSAWGKATEFQLTNTINAL